MAYSLPQPVIEIYDGIQVVNDTEAGTKFRMAVNAITKSNSDIFNFASSARGESPLAMARACQKLGRKLNLFYPDIAEYTPQMIACQGMGASVLPLKGLNDDNFDFVVAEAKARQGEFVTFNNVESVDVIAEAAQSLHITPDHVWSAGGLGGITRGLQKAWPDAQHYAVKVNPTLKADYGKAHVIGLDIPFEMAAKSKPPFSCNAYFEAKAWAALQEQRGNQQNIVFWNPANE